MRNILLQNLFTSLPDTAVVFYFYLDLQNSEFSKTSWVGSQILYMIFCQKFALFSMYSWSMDETLNQQNLSNPANTYLRLRQIQLG
jgi:hypothetical protein